MADENIVSPKTGSPVPAPSTTGVPPARESSAKVEQVQTLTEVENTTKEVDVDSLIPSDPYYMDPLFYEVANYFGLEQEDYDSAKNKLGDIVEHIIRELKDNSPDKVIQRLRQLEDSLQKPAWDEKRYTNVHKYVRLAQKQSTLQDMMKAYEKPTGKKEVEVISTNG